jgi:hemerythrin-like domain-containing protein
MMPIQIGRRPDHGFDEPFGLLSDCHRRIESFLETLTLIAAEAKGGPLSTGRRAELEAALAYFASAAPRHTADEEQSLFPRLRQSGEPAALEALKTLERLEGDHQEAERHHHSVDALGRRWLADGSLSSSDTGALRDHLAALQAIYREHIAIEDADLFPAAARALSAADVSAIGREMSARRAGKP